MKKLITLFAVSALALSMSVASIAQDAGPKGGGAPGKGGKLGGQNGPGKVGKLQQEILAKLNLTVQQKAQIEALNKKLQGDLAELRKSGDREAGRTKLKELMKNYQESLMKVLTEAQRAQYKKLMQELRNKRGDGKGKGNIPPTA